jgi:hypothetical protein
LGHPARKTLALHSVSYQYNCEKPHQMRQRDQ